MHFFHSHLAASGSVILFLTATFPFSAFAESAANVHTVHAASVTAECVSEYSDANFGNDEYLPLDTAEVDSTEETTGLYGAASDDLPTSCDMRTEGIITSVKNQGSDGMCWAFATLGAGESYLLKNNLAELDSDAEELDLSEEQVGYYLYTADPQPLSPTYYDAILQKNKGATGGNALHASFFLSTIGVQEEAYLPYQNVTATHSEYQRYVSAYRMTGSEMTISVRTDSERNAIKQRMLENGSVYVAFHNDITNYYDNGTSYAYYQTDYTYYGANHAILLVGWDDDYAKENFDPEEQPTSDGAWLARNSWGDGRLDDGYFWISYEDTSLGEYTTFSFEPREDSGNIYYYDNAGYSVAYSFNAVANVFTAEEDETLERIGFYQSSYNGSNAKYTISIYRLSEDTTDPTDGKLLTTATGTPGAFGYQEITLPKSVSLQKNDRFSVVLSMQIRKNQRWQNGYLTIEEEISGSSTSMQFSSEPGQSYILDEDSTTWEDTYGMEGEKGALHNVNLHAIMAPKEQDLELTQLNAVVEVAETAGETAIAEQARTLLEQTAEGTVSQTKVDCIAAMLLAELEQAEVVTYPDYAYENAHLAWGDMNEDGVIDVSDAVLCLTVYAKKAVGQPVFLRYRQLLQGDVDGTMDGITVSDAVEILTYYAKQAAGQEVRFVARS